MSAATTTAALNNVLHGMAGSTADTIYNALVATSERNGRPVTDAWSKSYRFAADMVSNGGTFYYKS